MTTLSKKLTLLLVGMLLLLADRCFAEPVRLRLLSYNIHHAEGVDGKLDLDRIAKVILAVDPDLVALQEVDRNVKRTRGVNQPDELARRTRLAAVFGANIELQGGQYGNAILSRHPIKRHENHLLPNVNRGEQRGVLTAEVAVPGLASPLLLLATHFDHRRGDAERVLSARAVNKLLKEDGRPAILMGDLNDVVGSEALRILEGAWRRTSDEPLPTVPVGGPKRQIDFILYRPAARWRVLETRVPDEAIASDHRPILSVLEYLPK